MIKIFFSIFVAFATSGASEIDTYELLMPNVYPYRDELYLCTPVRIKPDTNYNIVGFVPNATMHTAHHMLLYGCTEPGTDDLIWGCGEMQSDVGDKRYRNASPCKTGSQIVYAWARDAPALQLPRDVGFLVGRDSPIKYLVLQIHYMHRFPFGKTDDSGVFLKYTKSPMRRQAGVLLLGTGGVVAPSSVVHMETDCTISENKTIHPFAFRTHTHALGVEVSGYLVRHTSGTRGGGREAGAGGATGDVWTLVGRKNPQLPQMFYPVESTAPATRGDTLAARCTMRNPHSHPVRIGATNKDEMCNFYLMYWTEGAPLQQKYCFSAGPPHYSWRAGRLTNIPRALPPTAPAPAPAPAPARTDTSREPPHPHPHPHDDTPRPDAPEDDDDNENEIFE